MFTPTPSTTTSLRCVSVRALLAMALVALLVLTAVPTRRAEASQSGLDVDTAALQAAICWLAGGTSTVETTRTVGSGMTSIRVSCVGGLGGNWYCLTVFEAEVSGCYWNAFQSPTGGPADHTTTGGVVAEEPAHDVPAGDAPVAPVLVDEVVEEPVVEEPVVDEVVEEQPADEPDGDPADQPAGHDLGDEVAPDEPVLDAVVDAPLDDPVVVDPLVDPSLVDAEVAVEPTADGDVFEGE